MVVAVGQEGSCISPSGVVDMSESIPLSVFEEEMLSIRYRYQLGGKLVIIFTHRKLTDKRC